MQLVWFKIIDGRERLMGVNNYSSRCGDNELTGGAKWGEMGLLGF